MQGKFISIEGIEGAGKSSCIDCITNYLASQQIKSLTTHEPGGTNLAAKLRDILLNGNSEKIFSYTELLLLFAARNQHINLVIKPNLHSGVWVISDRFIDSTYAYQVGGRGIQQNLIDQLDKMLDNNIKPDLTFLLDIDIATSFKRINKRSHLRDRFESEATDFFTRVRETYLKLAKTYPHRIKVINANQSLVKVKKDIITILAAILAAKFTNTNL